MTREYFDLIIVVPLELELNEVFEVFPSIEDRTTDTHLRCVVDLGTNDFRALVVHQDQMGRAAAARCLRSALRDYDAGLIVCVGIAGTLTNDLALFDVCYSGEVVDVGENARVTDDDDSGEMIIDFQPTHFTTDKTLTQALNYARIVPQVKLIHEDWRIAQRLHAEQILSEINLPLEKLRPGTSTPTSTNGTIVCGPLVKSEKYKKRLEGIQRKLHAIEMEAGGLFEVAQEYKIPLGCLIIRGISDHADKNKAELEETTKGLARKIAAHSASSFLKMQFSNRYFVELLKKSKTTPTIAIIDSSAPLDLAAIASSRVRDIDEKLRELSPEYRLQPKGYRLPLPRLKNPVAATASDANANGSPLNSIDVVRLGGNLLLTLPRTYPDSSLAYILADALVVCEFDGKQVVPFVVDGQTLNPPNNDIAKSAQGYSLDMLGSDALVKLIFIVDEPQLLSKSKRSFLNKQMELFPTAQFVFLMRETAESVELAEFITLHNITSYKVGEISFSEIAHFVQKNFDLDSREADVIAFRIRETMQRFHLAAHPTYFAGIAKELLHALLVANRRSELIQLAVDGYLTFLVAEDTSNARLSRSTRERFLQRLAVELKVNRRNFSELELVELAKKFAAEYDFNIDPSAFVSAFMDKGILGFSDGRVVFYLPFIEHYLLATYLCSFPAEADKYFMMSDTDFDISTFDLYAEMGASASLVERIMKEMDAGIAELEKAKPVQEGTKPVQNVMLTNEVRPQLLSKPEFIAETQRRVRASLTELEADKESRTAKQFMLDMSDRASEQAVEERTKHSGEQKNGANLDAVSRIDGHFFVGTVLLGLGAENLTAAVKTELAARVLKLGCLIVDRWTRANTKVNFGEIKKKLSEQEFGRFTGDGLSEDEARKLLDDLLNVLELAFLSHPFRRVMDALCEQSRSKILATTLTRLKPDDDFERLVHALWLSDVDSKQGAGYLAKTFKRLRSAPFLAICVATHLMMRVFWSHWKSDDRLRLLDVAADVLHSVNKSIDKGKLKRMIKGEIVKKTP